MDLDSLDFDKVADERVAGSDADDVYDEEETAKSKKQKSKLKPIKTMGVTNETAELRKELKNFGSGGAKLGKASFWLAVACPKTLCTLLLPPRRWPSSHGYWGQRRGADAYHAIRQIL